MTERAASETEQRTQEATEEAREAAHALDEANPDVEEALGADVAKDAGVEPVGSPGADSGRGDELAGPGAPMP